MGFGFGKVENETAVSFPSVSGVPGVLDVPEDPGVPGSPGVSDPGVPDETGVLGVPGVPEETEAATGKLKVTRVAEVLDARVTGVLDGADVTGEVEFPGVELLLLPEAEAVGM